MSSELQIFEQPQFEETIVRQEVHTYRPNVASYQYSDEIEIVINQQDVLLALYDASIYIDISYVPEENATTCKLTNNFAAFLFESLTYELNGIELERVREPGLVTTLKTYLCCNQNEVKTLYTAGWLNNDNVTTSRNLTVCLPLKYLFSIFTDYKKVIMGKHRLRLVRARNDNNCYESSDDKRATITINSIELKVKHIYPHDELKLQIFKKLGNDQPITIAYRKWEIYELPALRIANREIWPIKTSTNLEKPRLVVVVFQKNRKNNPKTDITYFDNIDIHNIKLHLNSEFYPYEAMKVDFSNMQYVEPYIKYAEFQQLFFDDIDRRTEPYLSYESFKDKAIFLIDCSKQNEQLKSSTVDVKLEVEKNGNFDINTSVTCLIIHDSLVEYLPLSGTVKHLI